VKNEKFGDDCTTADKYWYSYTHAVADSTGKNLSPGRISETIRLLLTSSSPSPSGDRVPRRWRATCRPLGYRDRMSSNLNLRCENERLVRPVTAGASRSEKAYVVQAKWMALRSTYSVEFRVLESWPVLLALFLFPSLLLHVPAFRSAQV
jgi:hypothetical protein